VRGGKAMIATLRWRLIAVPGRLVRHARHLVLRLPPAMACWLRSWPGCETFPPRLTCASEPRLPSSSTALQPVLPEGPANREPGASTRAADMPATRNPGVPRSLLRLGRAHRAIRGFGSEHKVSAR